MSLEFGKVELENRPRAKRHLQRIEGVTRPVAGAPRRAHAPELAPEKTLSIGVEANTLTDTELILKSEIKRRRSDLVAVLVKTKMNFTKCDVTVMLAESREACKCVRKFSIVWKTVVTHRLKELKHLHAVEKLAAWRRTNGFDQCDVHDR